MIKNVIDLKKNLVCAHNGKGKIKFCRPFIKKDFKTKINFIDYAIIPPGKSIGNHQHTDNEEVYFIVKGMGTMFLGGRNISVKKGDIIVNKINGVHGLTNNSNKDIHLFVFEVLK